MPKVSIVIPVYNAEMHIERTMNQLLGQTEPDIEIIAVNDGSEDGSLALLKHFASNDDRVKVLTGSNKGPGVARNRGMDIAAGEYVLFLDIDDCFAKDLIEVMYQTAAETGADITICSALRYDAAFDLVKPFPEALRFQDIPYGKNSFSPDEVNTKLFQITGAFAWNKLFRRSFLKEANLRFAETYCYEDMAMLLPALVYAKKIAVTYKELIQYRLEAGGSLSDNRDKYYKALIWTVSEVLHRLEEIGKYEQFEQSYLNKILGVFCQIFRSYTSEEAFIALYRFVKNEFSEKLGKHCGDYYYSSYNLETLEVFLESETAMDFALRMFNIKYKPSQDVFLKYWLFPYSWIKKDSSIILFGAGDVGRDLYIQAKQTGWCNIAAWVDSAPDRYTHRGFPVENKTVIRQRRFDKVLVCIKDEETADKVCRELKENGIPSDRIVVYPPFGEKDKMITGLVNQYE